MDQMKETVSGAEQFDCRIEKGWSDDGESKLNLNEL